MGGVDNLEDLPYYGPFLGRFLGQLTELAHGEPAADLHLNASSAISLLYDLGLVPCPLWASVSS